MQEATTRDTSPGDGPRVRIGAEIGGFTIDRALAPGPVSDGWLCSRGSESFVFRVLREKFAADAQAPAHWLRASWAANRFLHARVVKVVSQIVDPGEAPVVVRGWARGKSLEESLGRGPLDPAFALRLVEQLLDALEMAHAHGIVHGALSPSNVIVTPRGSVRLVDFAAVPGLRSRQSVQSEAVASGLDRAPASSRPSALLAAARTSPFLAPEQRQSPPSLPSELSDVWSVGACLHYALTGAPPTEASPGTSRLVAAGEDLAAVIGLALSHAPADRYESAYAMLGDVRRVLSGRKPKLEASLAPLPSQSLAHHPPQPPSSSGMRGVRSEPQASSFAPRERRGNLLLMLAIAFLVGLATFVMVRERLGEAPARTMPPPTR